MSRVDGGYEGDRRLLRSLIVCVRDQTSLSHLLAPIADLDSIRAPLERLGDGEVV